MTSEKITDPTLGVIVDGSPTHDLFVSIEAIAAPASFPRWRAWAEQAALELSEPEMRRLRHWFGARLWLGRSYHVLVPLLAAPRDPAQLLQALSELPIGDFLRIAVTSGIVNPDAPLGADDLVALGRSPERARAYVERWLRVSGQLRTQVLRILGDPEGARAELIAVLRRQAELPSLRRLIEETSDERARATEALTRLANAGVEALQARVARSIRLTEFAPVMLAPSVFMDTKMGTYYQEVARSLLDGVAYEPLVFLIGTRRALGESPPTKRDWVALADKHDPLEQAAATFALLSDPSRLRLIARLARRPHYGQELATALGMSGATISHHTGLLLNAGVVTVERRAHRTYFKLHAEALEALTRGASSRVVGLLTTEESPPFTDVERTSDA